MTDAPWLVVHLQCGYCAYRYVAVVQAGSVGRECPSCGIYEPEFRWPSADDAPLHELTITPSA